MALNEVAGEPYSVTESEDEFAGVYLLIGYMTTASDLPKGQGAIIVLWNGEIQTWVMSTIEVIGITMALEQQLKDNTFPDGFATIVDVNKI